MRRRAWKPQGRRGAPRRRRRRSRRPRWPRRRAKLARAPSPRPARPSTRCVQSLQRELMLHFTLPAHHGRSKRAAQPRVRAGASGRPLRCRRRRRRARLRCSMPRCYYLPPSVQSRTCPARDARGEPSRLSLVRRFLTRLRSLPALPEFAVPACGQNHGQIYAAARRLHARRAARARAAACCVGTELIAARRPGRAGRDGGTNADDHGVCAAGPRHGISSTDDDGGLRITRRLRGRRGVRNGSRAPNPGVAFCAAAGYAVTTDGLRLSGMGHI